MTSSRLDIFLLELPVLEHHITSYPTVFSPAQLSMSPVRALFKATRAAPRVARPLSTSAARFNGMPKPGKERYQERQDEYEKIQKEQKPLNPHMTNTNSTIANEMPSIGKAAPPPELLASVDGDFTPKDSVPENTERMTGGTQKSQPESGVNADLDVGEIEGGSFRVEPLRRTGEDANTIRARLLCSWTTSTGTA